MRGGAQQGFALVQGLIDEPDLGELEITQPAVNQAAGPARSGVAEVRLLDEARAQAAARGIPRNAGTIDAAADDDEIERHAARQGRAWPEPRVEK